MVRLRGYLPDVMYVRKLAWRIMRFPIRNEFEQRWQSRLESGKSLDGKYQNKEDQNVLFFFDVAENDHQPCGQNEGGVAKLY